MLSTYSEIQKQYGSSYQINRAVERGDLYKISRGLYSNKRSVSPYAVVAKKYPDAIVTMDSAFYIHGLTDVIPTKVHLATRRNASRIGDKGIRQYFTEERLFKPGKTTVIYNGVENNIYSLERMLIELMRASSHMPLDYYKEIITSYRRRINDMDIRAIENYMNLFERNDYLFDIFQKEVL